MCRQILELLLRRWIMEQLLDVATFFWFTAGSPPTFKWNSFGWNISNRKKKSCVSTEPVANSVSMQRVINRGFEALVFPVSLFADTGFLVMENNRNSSVEKVFVGVNESFKFWRKVCLIPVQVSVYSNGSSSTSQRFSVIFETKEIWFEENGFLFLADNTQFNSLFAPAS